MDLSKLHLDKGVTVSNEMVTQLTHVSPRDVDAFRVAKLNVKGEIEQHLGRQGRICSVKVVRDGVRVLTDSEAVRHNIGLHVMGRRKFIKAAKQMGAVNVANLDEDEKRVHEIQNRRLAKAATAIRRCRAESLLAPVIPAGRY